MKLLTAAQVQRVFEVTDALGINRSWVVVPLAEQDSGHVLLLADGKVLICPPAGEAFNPWIAGLRARLLELDLSRTPRADELEPPVVNTLPDAPPGSGSRRYLNYPHHSVRSARIERRDGQP